MANKRRIRKAIIPAAGFGTRFLPITKAMPKEMLPVVDKPIIQYVVEEAVAAGIEDIIIVTGWHKRAIEDHFDYPTELIHMLEIQKKPHLLEEVKRIAELANFIYIRQKGPYGNGTPVLCAKHLVNDEPVAVLWGDEFIWAEPPRLTQMVAVFEEYGTSVISAIRIEDRTALSNYGIAAVEPVRDHIYRIKQLVEKPLPEEAPSNLAAHGAYILTPRIFELLATTQPGRGGEIWLTDAINRLAQEESVYALEIVGGHYYDTGNKLEYIKANIDFALRRPEIGPELRQYMKSLVDSQ